MQPKIPKIKMPGTSQFQLKTPVPNVTLNPEGFEEFIKSQGIRMIHKRPVPCPNVRDINASDHSPSCNLCFNGYLYYDQSSFTGAFMGNSLNRRFGAEGTWDQDEATVIIPLRDTEGNSLDVQYFDQLEVPDFTVRYYQRVEHTQLGIDRPQFKVLSIDFVVDAHGKLYKPGVDVAPDEHGRIKWLGSNRPGYDPVTGRGVVYSINYYTAPTFSVVAMPHQLRAAQTKDPAGGANIQAKFPQLVVVRKDFIPFDESDRVGAPDVREPSSGSHGPGPHQRPDPLNDQFKL